MCADRAISELLYLDNAATSYWKPDAVIDAVTGALRGLGNAGRGAHDSSLDAGRILHRARGAVAELFGAPPAGRGRPGAGRVAFAKNVTEALNVALRGLLVPGDHVITSAMEHNSVLRPLHALCSEGVTCTVVPIDERGRLRMEELASAFRPETKLVVLTHASNVTGNVTPIAEVSRLCREHGALLVLDTAQTAGVLPIDLTDVPVDVLCFTGHKGLLGPQGTGGLVLAPEVEVEPLLRGGTGIHSFEPDQPRGMPERLEAGTQNAHGLAGLTAGIEYVQSQPVSAIGEAERALALSFHDQVRDLPGVVTYGDFDDPLRVGIVSLTVGDLDSSEVSDVLMREHRIATRPGAHCAPGVHRAFRTVEQGMVRFSFSHRNTPQDVRRAAAAVAEIAAGASSS